MTQLISQYSYSTKMEYCSDFDVYDVCQTNHYKFISKNQSQTLSLNPLQLSTNCAFFEFDICKKVEEFGKFEDSDEITCTVFGCAKSYTRKSDITKHLKSHKECRVKEIEKGYFAFICMTRECGKCFFQGETFLEHYKNNHL